MPSGSLANRDFRVGESLVQPRLARIKRDAGTLHITPRAMAVLVYLAEANGAVVSRNAILDAVWPRMAVTPDALSQCLVELRRAFGDDSKHPRTIETIPRIGVRLIPPVRLEDYEPKPEAPASPVAAPAPPLATPAPGAVEARPEEAIAEAKARRLPRSYALRPRALQ
jgi:transcriptional activator of cad operon